MAMSRDMVLRLAAELVLTVRGSEVEAEVEGGRVRSGLELLDVVRAFRRPVRLDEAVASLTHGVPAHEWAQLNALIVELFEAGGLCDLRGARLHHRPSGFDAAAIHVRMLDDRARTDAFLAALRDAVRPDDVVIDLGSGTGVLALAAAEAGARRVYAVEQGTIADAAEEVFARHERITLLRGRSTELSLPEPATLLVSEIIGDEPLAERALEYLADARARLLAAGARQLPLRLRVYARGVKLDEATRRVHRFDPEQAARWSSWYALDLVPLARAEVGEGYRFFATPEQAACYLPRTDPVLLASIDLARGPAAIEHTGAANVTDSGGIDALVSWFELDVDEQRTLTNEPTRAAESCHWRCPVWLLPRGLAARTGESLAIHYRYGPAGTRLFTD